MKLYYMNKKFGSVITNNPKEAKEHLEYGSVGTIDLPAGGEFVRLFYRDGESLTVNTSSIVRIEMGDNVLTYRALDGSRSRLVFNSYNEAFCAYDNIVIILLGVSTGSKNNLDIVRQQSKVNV